MIPQSQVRYSQHKNADIYNATINFEIRFNEQIYVGCGAKVSIIYSIVSGFKHKIPVESLDWVQCQNGKGENESLLSIPLRLGSNKEEERTTTCCK